MSEHALRQELASVVTPRVRQWIFMRQLAVRSVPHRIGVTLQSVLQRIASGGGSDVISFPDFSALTVACARDAIAGGLGNSWHWQALGLPRSVGPGEAVGKLLVAHPLETGTAVVALAKHGLLGPVWRDIPPLIALELTHAVTQAAQVPLPDWPSRSGDSIARAQLTVPEPVLARAGDFWGSILSGMSPQAEPVRAAAVLALLRWSPHLLSAGRTHLPAKLLERLTRSASARVSGGSPTQLSRKPPRLAEPDFVPTARDSVPFESPIRDAPSAAPAAESIATARNVDQVATQWGGILFLINAFNRLNLGERLASAGPDGPGGWRVLLDVALALGIPCDEPLATFIAANDPDSPSSPELTHELIRGLEALYAKDGPWPLPLMQCALLEATPTHLDLHLLAQTVDVAVRIAGLDLDPGWVSWLGRIVHFHYDHLPVHFAAPG